MTNPSESQSLVLIGTIAAAVLSPLATLLSMRLTQANRLRRMEKVQVAMLRALVSLLEASPLTDSRRELVQTLASLTPESLTG